MADYEASDLTEEELKFLALRRKLKDHYRKQFREDSSTSALPLDSTAERKGDDFGSFFGPSLPTIIPSVIENTTSLLQFEVFRMSNPNHGLKKVVDQPRDAKIVKPSPRKTKVDPAKLKLQKMKEARDYSFLLSGDAPAKPPRTRRVSAPNTDQTSPKTPKKGRPVLKKKKPVSSSGNQTSSDRKSSDEDAGMERKTESNLKVEPKLETITLKKKVTINVGKPVSKAITKPVVSSLQDQTKKRPQPRMNTEADGFDYRSEIQKMFGYDPNKYRDDGDTKGMEAGFPDILKEERRSALIARKEDQIEQKRIEDEERKERIKKPAKRPKQS